MALGTVVEANLLWQSFQQYSTPLAKKNDVLKN
jgi:hypothetical protein